ncbi:hypothetical protein B0H11DRAFT_1843736 [Mycena galericulata]|nr:hypothetical protein B0H11DRAFT_1843736 [Mycena galericulata]
MASPLHEPHEEDEDSQNESQGDFESDDDASSVSSFNENDMPSRSFDPMPAHLTLPVELHRVILSCETNRYHEPWGTYRFVCKTWKEHIEFLAKTEWIRDASFTYPGEMIWDPTVGKVSLSGDFTFQRLDGDLAVFRILECAPEFKKDLIKACKRTSPPDVEIGDIVHDVEIPDMSVDWDNLTLTCPWRSVIGRVLAEELRVEAHRKLSHHAMMTTAKLARRRAPGGQVDMNTMLDMFKLFANKSLDAYAAVRTARRGGADKKGDERLKMARHVASMRDL